jgi:hypothetical protein
LEALEQGDDMTRSALALLLFTATIALGASAAEVGGVKLADKASVGGQELVLNGAGIRTRAIFKVYVAALYLPAKATTLDAALAKAPRRIQLSLLRNLSADTLSGALTDGLKEANSPAELDAIKAETAQMATIMKGFGDVKEGDVVTLDFVDGATKVGLNGTTKDSIAGDTFNRALTRIWIGDRAVQDDVKRALLGGS